MAMRKNTQKRTYNHPSNMAHHRKRQKERSCVSADTGVVQAYCAVGDGVTKNLQLPSELDDK